MKAHIWIPTGANRKFAFNFIDVGEPLTENRVIKILRDGTEQMLDQAVGIFPSRLNLIITGEEIDSIDLFSGNRYFVNQIKKHLEYKNLYPTPIRVFLNTENHVDNNYDHKAYDCFVAPGGLDPMAAAIGISLSENPSFNPTNFQRNQTYIFELWVQRDGYWDDFEEYEEEDNIVWRSRP